MCGSISLYGLCISSYYGKYEVFDLQVTMTLIIYLQMTLSLVKASQHGVIANLFIMNILRYLTLTFDLDHGEISQYGHCKICYYEQFEVFDLEMTLTFDLQLNVTLTNASQHFIRRK